MEYVYCGIYLIAIVVQNVSKLGAYDNMLETVQMWFCHENVKNKSQIYLFLFYKVFSVIMIGVTIGTERT